MNILELGDHKQNLSAKDYALTRIRELENINSALNAQLNKLHRLSDDRERYFMEIKDFYDFMAESHPEYIDTWRVAERMEKNT